MWTTPSHPPSLTALDQNFPNSFSNTKAPFECQNSHASPRGNHCTFLSIFRKHILHRISSRAPSSKSVLCAFVQSKHAPRSPWCPFRATTSGELEHLLIDCELLNREAGHESENRDIWLLGFADLMRVFGNDANCFRDYCNVMEWIRLSWDRFD